MARFWGIFMFGAVLFICSLAKGEVLVASSQDEDGMMVDVYRQIAKSVAALDCPELNGEPRIIRKALEDAFIRHGYGLEDSWVDQMAQLVQFYSEGNAYLERTFDVGYISGDKHDFFLVIDAKSKQSRTYVISPRHEGVFCGEKAVLATRSAKK